MISSKHWQRALVAAALCVLPASVTAAPSDAVGKAALKPAAPKPSDPKISFERYTLPNGLEVILSPDRRVPIVAVNIWYHVGSGHESLGRSGFAHLFEHMMFQGSKNVGNDQHFDVLRKIGVGDTNGSTNTDRTDYYESVPSNQLETALWLESDRMGYLLDPNVFTKKSLDNQIDVVRNERRWRYENVPFRRSSFVLHEAMYPEGHPYRYTTIGKHADLVAASLEDVKSFFKTWYVPANATLTLVGDFDPAAAKQLVQKWFGTFPRSMKPTPVVVPAPPVASKEVTVEDNLAKLRQITFAWHSPAFFAEGDAELDVAADALDRVGSGALYKALVYDRPLAQSVEAGQGSMTFSGMFRVTVTLRSEANLDEVKKIVAAEIARLRAELLPQKRLSAVVAKNEALAIHALESIEGRAAIVQRYNHYLGDPDKLTWDLDRYRKTTPEKVRAAADKYLRPDRMVTVITMPSGGAK